MWGEFYMSKFEIYKVDATERLDAASVKDFKESVKKIIENENSIVLVDFCTTKFIDSAGLGALVSVLKSAAQQECVKIALISLSPQINQIFELTKLCRLFDIFANEEEAKQTLLTE